MSRHASAVLLALLALLGGCGNFEQELLVRVIDPRGRLLGGFAEGADVYLTDARNGEIVATSKGFTTGGQFVLNRNQDHVVLRVHSPGCRTVSVPDPPAQVEIHLEYGIEVEIHLLGVKEMPAAPLSLELVVEPLEGFDFVRYAMAAADSAWFQSPHTIRAKRIVVPSSRTMRLWFPSAGEFELGWMLCERHDVREPGRVSLGGAGHGPGRNGSRIVQVEDRPDQVFDLTLDPRQLEEMRAYFK